MRSRKPCFMFSLFLGGEKQDLVLTEASSPNLLSECMKDIELKAPRGCMVSLHGELSTK